MKEIKLAKTERANEHWLSNLLMKWPHLLKGARLFYRLLSKILISSVGMKVVSVDCVAISKGNLGSLFYFERSLNSLKDIPGDIQPHIQTTDTYIQPYINQLKDTITRLECDKSKLEEDKNNLWQEISQLHLNHMKVMDKIILLPPRKEEETPKEMPKKKGFGFVRM